MQSVPPHCLNLEPLIVQPRPHPIHTVDQHHQRLAPSHLSQHNHSHLSQHNHSHLSQHNRNHSLALKISLRPCL